MGRVTNWLHFLLLDTMSEVFWGKTSDIRDKTLDMPGCPTFLQQQNTGGLVVKPGTLHFSRDQLKLHFQIPCAFFSLGNDVID